MTSSNEMILLATNSFLEDGIGFSCAKNSKPSESSRFLELVILISLRGTLDKKPTANDLLNIFELMIELIFE